MTTAKPPTAPTLHDPGDTLVPAADSFLSEASALADRRAALVAGLWSRSASRFALDEVLARRDVHRIDADLARLLADSRLVLVVASLADRIANLEAAAPANGGAA